MKIEITCRGIKLTPEGADEQALLKTLSAARAYTFAPVMTPRMRSLQLVAGPPTRQSWRSGVIFGQRHAARLRAQEAAARRKSGGSLAKPRNFPQGFLKLHVGDQLQKGDVYLPGGGFLVPTCASGEFIRPGDATYYRPRK